jgi:hypothetical protein
LAEREIFVFGSNLAGRHGRGAALWARKNRGAIYGQGIGLQGDSYGIPTKDEKIKTLPLEAIAEHVSSFVQFARNHPDLRFRVTPVGCGLAGYHQSEILPLFEDMPDNCFLSPEWTITKAER